MADFSINVKIGGVEQSISTIAQLENALRATKEELKNVEIGSQAFEELGQQAAKVQKELQNSFKEVVNFDKSIAQLGESVSRIGSTIAAGFTIATSAISLLGGESEELSQAQIKAQQALAIALGATTLATNAKKLAEDLENISAALGLQTSKEKIVATNVETASIEANTAATEANVVATEAEVIATETATVATRGFTAALLSNPLTAILVGLTAVIGALVLFSDGEKKATKEVKNNNEELERQLKNLQDDAKFRNDISGLRTKLAVIEAKTESERAKIELDAARELRKAKQEQIAQQRIVLEQRDLELSQAVAFFRIQQQLAKQGSNFKFTPEDKKNFDEAIKAYDANRKSLNDLTTQALQSEVELKQAEADFTSFTTKTATTSTERIKAFNDALKNLLSGLRDTNLSITREITKAGIDNLAKEDDILGTFDERLKKLQLDRSIDLADAKSSYEKDLENFNKTAKEKGISGQKLKDAQKLIEEEYLNGIFLIQVKYADLEKQTEQEKADKIKLIDDILKTELSFGDNNLYDSRKKLSAEQVQYELNQAKRQIQEEELLDKINVDKLIKSASGKDKKILDLRKQALKAQADAEIEILRNQEALAITQVQGTEEQKAIAIEGIKDQYRQKEKEINEKFRQAEFDAEIETAKKIRDARFALAQDIINTAQQIVSSLQTINSEYDKLQADRQAAAINNIYDSAQAQIDAQKAALDAGIIDQKEYDANIAQIQKDANDRKIAEDDKYAEKAFKIQKALSLASAAVQIANSILQALGSLPPPFSYISAGISAAAGAVQLALISQQQYRKNADRTSSVTLPEITATQANTGAAQVSQATTGGFTQFNQALVGTPTGSLRTAPTSPGTANQRVYVVESDITSAQRRVRVLENNSTFG